MKILEEAGFKPCEYHPGIMVRKDKDIEIRIFATQDRTLISAQVFAVASKAFNLETLEQDITKLKSSLLEMIKGQL